MRNERRSKPVSLDALAARGTHEIPPEVNKNTDDQKAIIEDTDATIKMLSSTTASRPALFSAFDLKVSADLEQDSLLDYSDKRVIIDDLVILP